MKKSLLTVIGAGMLLSACTVNNYYDSKSPPPPLPHGDGWHHCDMHHPMPPKPDAN